MPRTIAPATSLAVLLAHVGAYIDVRLCITSQNFTPDRRTNLATVLSKRWDLAGRLGGSFWHPELSFGPPTAAVSLQVVYNTLFKNADPNSHPVVTQGGTAGKAVPEEECLGFAASFERLSDEAFAAMTIAAAAAATSQLVASREAATPPEKRRKTSLSGVGFDRRLHVGVAAGGG